MAHSLEALARRVQDDPDFLASALADYARSEGLDDAELAARLGCDVRQLSMLRLCRRPRPEPDRLQRDVARIAAAFTLDETALLEAVRRADALSALRTSNADAGLLMVARDRNGAEASAHDDGENAP